MRVPQPLKEIGRQGAIVRTAEYDDGSVIAVDFGSGHDEMDADIVGTRVIVVFDDQQFEFNLPTEATDVTVNNGVLTIKE